MNLNARRFIALLVVDTLSILFGLAAWIVFSSTALTLIFIVLGALVRQKTPALAEGIEERQASQRQAMPKQQKNSHLAYKN